jgi:hypothetical protein
LARLLFACRAGLGKPAVESCAAFSTKIVHSDAPPWLQPSRWGQAAWIEPVAPEPRINRFERFLPFGLRA